MTSRLIIIKQYQYGRGIKIIHKIHNQTFYIYKKRHYSVPMTTPPPITPCFIIVIHAYYVDGLEIVEMS